MKLYINFGDDDNRDFHEQRGVEVDGTVGTILKNRDTSDVDAYWAAWDEMLDAVSEQHRDLPKNWFIDSIER